MLKATRIDSDGLVFAGRTRLRGIVFRCSKYNNSCNCSLFEWNNGNNLFTSWCTCWRRFLH